MRFARKLGTGWHAVAILLFFAGAMVASAQPLLSTRRHSSLRKSQPQQIAAAVPLPEPVVRLRVSCDDGLLSIAAQSAQLHSILDQVSRCIGAAIDKPEDADEIVVAVQLGPAPAMQVVVALLDITHFNYLIAGAPNDPGAVRSIQLTLKPSTPLPAVAAAVAETEERPVPMQSDVKANLTGGDEGGSDDVEVGTPNAPPSLPVTRPTAATPPE